MAFPVLLAEKRCANSYRCVTKKTLMRLSNKALTIWLAISKIIRMMVACGVRAADGPPSKKDP